jgi:hypothetical protein
MLQTQFKPLFCINKHIFKEIFCKQQCILCFSLTRLCQDIKLLSYKHYLFKIIKFSVCGNVRDVFCERYPIDLCNICKDLEEKELNVTVKWKDIFHTGLKLIYKLIILKHK